MKEEFTKWLERETAFKTQMEFDYWLENLDVQEVVDRANEWMNVTRAGLSEWLEAKSVNGTNNTEDIIEFINRK